MKQKFAFFAVLMMVLAIPQSVKAYVFSSVSSSGHTIYYNITQYPYNGAAQVEVTYYNTSSNPWPTGSSVPTGDLIIPDSVTYNGATYLVISIGDYAFKNCNGLTSVSIPSSVTSIGYQSFYNCSGLIGTLIIRNSVSSVGGFAFANCSRLSSITIGSNVSTIGFMAFYNVRHVEYHGNATGAPWEANSINGITDGDFVFSNNSKDTLIAYIGDGGDVSIPPSVSVVGNYAFRAFPGTFSVTFPGTLISIGGEAFYGCVGLSGTLSLPNTVTSIQGRAFAGCTGLSGSLFFPDSLTTLGNNAFNGCSGLTGDLHIGNNITTIDDRAFYGCSGITSLTIGSSVTSIGYESFCGCVGLSVINSLPNEAPSLDYGSFNGISDTIKVKIPCGSGASYTYYWTTSILLSNSNFIEERVGFQVWSNNIDMGNVSVLQHPNCQNSIAYIRAKANTGYKFISWSDGSVENPRSLTVVQDTSIVAFFDNCDTIFVHDTTTIYDTVTLTEYISYYDTTYVDVYVHDTTTLIDTMTLIEYVPVHDTTYIDFFVHDTTTVIDTVTLTEYVPVHDTTFIDVFVHDTTTVIDTVTLTEYVPVHDTTYIDVYVHDTTTITDTVTLTEYVPVHDTTYIDVFIHDTTTITDTVTLTEYVPVHDTTYIDVHDTTYITLTDTVTNTIYDTITNTIYDTVINTIYDTVTNTEYVYDTVDNYFYDTTVVYSTDTLWLHDTVFVHDTIFIYDTIYVSVDEVDTISAKVYTSRGQIVVEGAEGNIVWLYDVNGRVLATKQDEYTPLHFDVPASGAYMVKIGNHPARKVVVIR